MADLRPKGLAGPVPGDPRRNAESYDPFLASGPETKPWGNFTRCEITATDIWRSNVIRRLTPIERSRQKVRFVIDLATKDVEMFYLDGPSAGRSLGLRDGKAFRSAEGKRVEKSSGKVDLYVAPVRDYFLWPRSLVHLPHSSYLGQENGRHRFLAGELGLEARKDSDQYIIWLEPWGKGRVEKVQFTMRKLLPSYRGFVIYEDYRDVQGIPVPHKVILSDDKDGMKVSHHFEVENVRFE